ncbi:NUDIX hydrolase [Actinoplanes sp. SE50]|uniref:NUDIX hydrolase n=1 Tax=unclassified Actinoplanes TaxID=2626549 RepID=UPI00023EBED6|nr:MULTISPECIES: NUDIX domain-containing protein [unclassified Actinoplanes]AEV83482.1 RNA pyrophosphohydrolase [Actinoplanes sp. SE50/110]ATO81875.1 NUDIX hydrolase [Actinoplanes sp. SE50]SLL99283.1 NUDIX hydrolase [Actinoplanes sp. SE50/110]
MEVAHRPAVRVLCFDADGRILLMHWQDPLSGVRLWEPPGGGIDPGETPLETARRELTEETGLDPDRILPEHVDVDRDTVWKGRRFVGAEQFFAAFYPDASPAVSRAGLLPYEQADLLGHAWIHPDDLGSLPDRLEPPALAAIAARMVSGPAGPG